jgi:hypothetical protein
LLRYSINKKVIKDDNEKNKNISDIIIENIIKVRKNNKKLATKEFNTNFIKIIHKK